MGALVIAEQRLFPLRGLVLLQNAKGKPFVTIDVKRWLLINRQVHKTPKVDVLVRGNGWDRLVDLLEFAESNDIRLSLRTDCPPSTPDLQDLEARGLKDVFLCPEAISGTVLDNWFDVCREAGLPVRLQLQPPFPDNFRAENWADRVAQAGVTAVNMTVADPFSSLSGRYRNKEESLGCIQAMNDLTRFLEQCSVEANLVGIPFCLVPEANRKNVLDSKQYFRDHQQYARGPYDLAGILNKRGPIVAGKIILSLLWRNTLHVLPGDERLLNWLMHDPTLYLRLAFWRKLTRHLRIGYGVPKELDLSRERYEYELRRRRKRTAKREGPECAKCCLRRICDHAHDSFRKALPGVDIKAQKGDNVAAPLHFAVHQPKYYDSIDRPRLTRNEHQDTLAEKANTLMLKQSPKVSLTPKDYSVEYTYFEPMEGGIKWYSVLNTEKLSSPLGIFSLPCTIAVTFAGGMADYIGFSIDRSCKLVCPMETFKHTLVLHAEANGRYVLIRDGKPVRPSEFESACYVPTRIPERIAPRISIWNIDTSIVTQHVRIWEPGKRDEGAAGVKYSVIIVCTRFARRLQATLLCLAHQTGLDMSKLEVIVAYVPGLDAVDDVIDCTQSACPRLRIVRSTFTPQKAHGKGFMINESIKLVSGEWTVIMDADTLVPPDFFARVEEVAKDARLIAPDGRKMLTPETTARILVGDIHPWESWDELINGPGEYRRREARGLPVGFCQVAPVEAFEHISYGEVEHFELADMWFSEEMVKRYGSPKWLRGVPVLHLDHGGSQWYGTPMHR